MGGSQGGATREFHCSSSSANTPLVRLDEVETRQVDTMHSRITAGLLLVCSENEFLKLDEFAVLHRRCESSEKNRVKRGMQLLGLLLQKECSWSSNPGFEEGYEQMATGRLSCSHQIYFN